MRDFSSQTKSFFGTSAKIIEFGLWVVFISISIYLVYRYREQLLKFIDRYSPYQKKTQTSKAPDVMFGLDIRRDSIPQNVPEQVQALWANGESREALGLLYRATLSSLIHTYNFNFCDGDTEGECIAVVKTRNDELLSNFMLNVTLCWQSVAYGHRLPAKDTVNVLCEQWRQVFPFEQ